MTSKKRLSLIVFSLIFQFLSAQNYLDGVIFTSEAQRIVGTIKIINNRSVKIKHPTNKKGQLLAADQIETIELANGNIYVSKVWEDNYLFLQKLVEGNTELYQLAKKNKAKEQPFFLKIDKELVKLAQKDYLGRISYYTNDCPNLVQMNDKTLSKKIPYRPEELTNIIHQYNQCKNVPSKALYQKSKVINFGFVGGLHSNKISFNSGLLSRVALKPKIGYHIGGVLTANIKSSFSLNLELAANSEGINPVEITPFRVTHPERFFTVDFNTTRIQAAFLADKKFGSLTKKHPFIELGLFFGNVLKNKINYNFPDEIQEPTRENLMIAIEPDNYGFILGTGLVFPTKTGKAFFVKLRYTRKRFNTITALSATTDQFGLLTGIRF